MVIVKGWGELVMIVWCVFLGCGMGDEQEQKERKRRGTWKQFIHVRRKRPTPHDEVSNSTLSDLHHQSISEVHLLDNQN